MVSATRGGAITGGRGAGGRGAASGSTPDNNAVLRMMEEMMTEIRAVREEVAGLREQITGMEERMAAVVATQQGHDVRVGVLETTIALLDERMRSMERASCATKFRAHSVPFPEPITGSATGDQVTTAVREVLRGVAGLVPKHFRGCQNAKMPKLVLAGPCQNSGGLLEGR